MIKPFATVAPRESLVRTTETHLVVSVRALLGLLTALAAVGIALGVVGLREAYTRLPADGDTVLTVAITVASTSVLCAVSYLLWTTRTLRRTRR